MQLDLLIGLQSIFRLMPQLDYKQNGWILKQVFYLIHRILLQLLYSLSGILQLNKNNQIPACQRHIDLSILRSAVCYMHA